MDLPKQITNTSSGILKYSIVLAKAKELGIRPIAKILSHASVAHTPEWFTTAPGKAISKVLAKAKLADRINGKMNNQSSINKSETGIDENNNITGSAEDTIVNLINNTLVRDYIVEKVEIFYTHHKSYRAYVKVKVSKDNVSLVIQEINTDKKLVQKTNKNQNRLKSKVKEVLKNLD